MSATPSPTPDGEQGFFDWIGDTVNGVGDAIGGTVSFWSDPFLAMYKASREAVTGLSTDLIPALTGATLPELTLPAFLETYAVSFALSLFVAVVLLVVQLLRTASGRQSGRDTFHAIGMYFPGFILGAMFGPAAGMLLINFVHALSDSVVGWAYQGSSDQLAAVMEGILLPDPAKYAGGAQIMSFVGWAMAISMFFVVLLFVVQLLTLYFSGVLIPLATVWVIDPTRRGTAVRALAMWAGILLTHPLLFLLIGFAFRIISGTLMTWGNDLWKNLISALVVLLSLVGAILSPFFLLKFVKGLSSPGAPANGPSAPTIGPTVPTTRPSPSSPSMSPSSVTPGTAQAVRNSAAPAGQSLRDAAASRAAGAGATRTAAAAGASRAGMAAGTGAGVAAGAAGAAVSVAAAGRRAYQATEAAAAISATPPPAESYGRTQP